MALSEDLELGEIAVILVAVIVIGYYLKKGLGAIAPGLQAVVSGIGSEVSFVGQGIVATPAIVSTAAQQVFSPSIILSDDTPIGMAGTTVGDLRKEGFSESAIADLIAQTYGSF